MTKLFGVLRAYSRTDLVLTILLGAISGAGAAGLIAIVHKAIDAEQPWGSPVLFGGFALLWLLAPALRVLSKNALADMGQKAIYDLRMDISRRMLATPLEDLERIGTSRLLAVLTRDVASISTALTVLPSLSINGALVLGALSYLGFLSWRTLVVLFVALVAALLTYRIPLAIGRRKQGQARERVDELYGHFRSLSHGVKELKMHRPRRDGFLELLGRSGEAFRVTNLSTRRIFNFTESWGEILVFAGVGLLIFVLPQFGLLDDSQLTGYVLVLLYIVNPLSTIMTDMPTFSDAEVSVRKIEGLGIAPSAPQSMGREGEAPPAWERLTLRDVEYRYPGREGSGFRLGPLSLDFTPGELVFLIGGNGSGKTTLAKVLLGLYDPSEGEVLLDGEPVDTTASEPYRALFTSIFADTHLFDRLLGLEGGDLDERARGYLERLRLTEHVDVEKGRLSTLDLSQGQKKRLALLTALLEDRPIYMFDEWAADQDPLFREIFYREILPGLRRRGKTVFVISHDDRYYDYADRVIKLDWGRVVSDRRYTEEDPGRSEPPGSADARPDRALSASKA